MLSVKLFSRTTGRALPLREVSLGFDLLERGVVGPVYTDQNGEVRFYEEPGLGKVYVDGRRQHAGWLAGRVIVHV
jgi:hypothetical protein